MKSIIELAREAGLYVGTNLSGVTLVGAAKSNGLLIHMTVDDLASFATLVRARTLEEAEKLCDDLWQDDGTAYDCREAIRALKEKT